MAHGVKNVVMLVKRKSSNLWGRDSLPYLRKDKGAGKMFGSYEDDIKIFRRKIPYESGQPIIIENKTRESDDESIEVNIDIKDGKQNVQNDTDVK